MADPGDRIDDLLREQRAILARLDALAEKRPPLREEPLEQVVRRLKAIRYDLDAQIAYFDALLAGWKRASAAGDVASLPDLTRRLTALEARLAQIEGHPPEEDPTP